MASLAKVFIEFEKQRAKGSPARAGCSSQYAL